MDSNQTLHLKGLDYSLSIFYRIKPPSKFYRFDTNPNRKVLTQILPFINSQRITIETFLERLFWDSAEFIESTDFLEDFCFGMKKQLKMCYKKKDEALKFVGSHLGQSPKKCTPPSKTVFILGENETRSYDYQFYATYFDKGEFKFDTSSINLRECLRIYKREVYGLLKCRNWYFHNFVIEFNFLDLFYLEKLKSEVKVLGNEFIRLRFCNRKLMVTLKRGINDNIRCSGNVLQVLNDFLLFGMIELYKLLSEFDICTTDFKESLRLETYTQYHLAKDIGCNIEKEQPELLKRLKLNQMNDMESLANIGLENHWHYVDYSHEDDYGDIIPEYELQYRCQDGMSRAELERDLLTLEPDFRPREQTTLDKFLNDNKKAYMLIKGFVPISEFTIEANRSISNRLPLEHNSFMELHDSNKKAISFLEKPILITSKKT